MKALESLVGCSNVLIVSVDVESPAPEPRVRVHMPPSSLVDGLSGHVVMWLIMIVAVDLG